MKVGVGWNVVVNNLYFIDFIYQFIYCVLFYFLFLYFSFILR